jgi:arylsulfatase
MSSFAAMFDLKMPEDAARDGMDLSKLLTGDSQTGRDELVEEGHGLALRKGDWKLIEEVKKAPELYNLKDDPSEKTNVAEKRAEIVKQLAERLQQIRQGK